MVETIQKLKIIAEKIRELKAQKDDLRYQLEDEIFYEPNLTPRQRQRRRQKYNKQTAGGRHPEFYKG